MSKITWVILGCSVAMLLEFDVRTSTGVLKLR